MTYFTEKYGEKNKRKNINIIVQLIGKPKYCLQSWVIQNHKYFKGHTNSSKKPCLFYCNYVWSFVLTLVTPEENSWQFNGGFINNSDSFLPKLASKLCVQYRIWIWLVHTLYNGFFCCFFFTCYSFFVIRWLWKPSGPIYAVWVHKNLKTVHTTILFIVTTFNSLQIKNP